MNEYLDYARRGRTDGWRYPVTLALALLISVGGAIALLLPATIAGWLPEDLAGQMTSPTHPTVFFVGTGATFAVLGAGVWLAGWWVHAKRLADLVGRWRWSLVIAGFLTWGLVLASATAIDWLISPASFTVSASAATPKLALLALAALLPQVFVEELIFRGYLTQGFLLAFKRIGPASVLSGLVFGALHIPNGLPQAAAATLFGVLTAAMAIRLGGLAFSFGLHLANNLFGSVLVVSAQDVFRGAPGVLTQDTPHLMWWDMMLSSAGLLAVLLVVWRRLGPSLDKKIPAPARSPPGSGEITHSG